MCFIFYGTIQQTVCMNSSTHSKMHDVNSWIKSVVQLSFGTNWRLHQWGDVARLLAAMEVNAMTVTDEAWGHLFWTICSYYPTDVASPGRDYNDYRLQHHLCPFGSFGVFDDGFLPGAAGDRTWPLCARCRLAAMSVRSCQSPRSCRQDECQTGFCGTSIF